MKESQFKPRVVKKNEKEEQEQALGVCHLGLKIVMVSLQGIQRMSQSDLC